MDVAVSRTVNIQRRFEARKTRFLAHGAFAKVFGRASTTQATTTHRNAPKTSDNDSPCRLARSSKMNRPFRSTSKAVWGCTFLSVFTARSERKGKVKRVGLHEASRERSDGSERIVPFFRFSPRTIHPIERDGLEQGKNLLRCFPCPHARHGGQRVKGH